MKNTIILRDKEFEEYISRKQIEERIDEMSTEIDQNYKGKTLTMIGNLTGAFIIMADLCRSIRTPVDVKFVKYTSYTGMSSTHVVSEKMGFDDMDLEGEHIMIVEDIIDTGLTLGHLLKLIDSKGAASVCVFSLLLKPEALRREISVDYLGFEIPNEFVVGYGLDYDGLGRDLDSIYKLKAPEK